MQPAEKLPEKSAPAQAETVAPFVAKKSSGTMSAAQASRAERELMQALEKLG
jgi:hypothetical protein